MKKPTLKKMFAPEPQPKGLFGAILKQLNNVPQKPKAQPSRKRAK